jgi:hypothetical protein
MKGTVERKVLKSIAMIGSYEKAAIVNSVEQR